jgi:uncharacterized protein YcfJ
MAVEGDAMTSATLVRDEELQAEAPAEPEEPGLVFGRPAEDRGFEVVEASVGVATGLVIGTAVAGPLGAAVGGVIGAAAGLMAGEAVERAAGKPATTMDAGEPETPIDR